MTTTETTSYAPGSVEWHEQRRTRLGGSEIGAVLGLSTYESPLSLWLTKAGAVDPQPSGVEAEWGNRLEAAVLEKWLDEHLDHHRVESGTYVRDGWMIATPDAIVTYDIDDRMIVEIKTSPYGDGWGPVDEADDEGDPLIPPMYLLQVRWYLHVLGVQIGHVAVLIGGCDYREYTVVQRQDHVELMVNAGRAFLDSIESGDQPDVDTHSRTYEVLQDLHPDIDDVPVEISAAQAEAYLEAKAAAEDCDAEYRRQKSLMLVAMGMARVAMVGKRKIARRQTTGNSKPYLVCAVRKAKAQIPTHTKEHAA